MRLTKNKDINKQHSFRPYRVEASHQVYILSIHILVSIGKNLS